jgi:hypothetical protein
MRSPLARVGLVVTASAIAACDDSTQLPSPMRDGTPALLRMEPGLPAAPANPYTITARVANAAGEPIEGVEVEWSLVLPGYEPCIQQPATASLVCALPLPGAVSDGRLTDVKGGARATIRAPIQGDYRVTATAGEVSASQVLTLAPGLGVDGSMAWEPVPMPFAHYGSLVATDGLVIYLLRGACGDAPSLTCFRANLDVYDPDGQEWRSRSPSPMGTNGHTSSVAAFVADGFHVLDAGGTEIRHWRYDSPNDVWSGRPAPPTTFGFGSTAAADPGRGLLLFVGSGTVEDMATWSYDLATASWTRRAPAPRPAFFLAAVRIGSKLALVGISEVQWYDPAADVWTVGPPLPIAGRPAAGSLNGRLCVFGGAIYGMGLYFQQIYGSYCWNPSTNQWLSGPPLAGGATQGIAAVELNGALYAFGGMSAPPKSGRGAFSLGHRLVVQP